MEVHPFHVVQAPDFRVDGDEPPLDHVMAKELGPCDITVIASFIVIASFAGSRTWASALSSTTATSARFLRQGAFAQESRIM
jgi:hypothetical protein